MHFTIRLHATPSQFKMEERYTYVQIVTIRASNACITAAVDRLHKTRSAFLFRVGGPVVLGLGAPASQHPAACLCLRGGLGSH